MRVILLFSYGTTLSTWKKQGFLARESSFYKKLLRAGCQRVSFVTYGRDDKQYQQALGDIRILPKRGFNHLLLYAFSLPFVYFSEFRNAHIIKSNQSQGSWVGLMVKCLMPWKRLIVRCGWVRNTEMLVKRDGKKGYGLWYAMFLERLCFRFSDSIVVTTPTDKQFVVGQYQIRPGKIEVIPNCVDTDIFFPAKDIPDIHNEMKIILVGRFARMKNFHSVLEAVPMVAHRISVTLIGSGEYQQELEELAEDHRLQASILKNIDNDLLPDYLRQHNVFIMPQYFASGMSKVMIEAMACGLISIGTELQAHREVIDEGVNGFICGHSPQQIAGCLRRILSMSTRDHRGISERARNDMDRKFSMRACVQQEYALYTSLTAGARRSTRSNQRVR